MAGTLDLALVEPVLTPDPETNFRAGAEGVRCALELGASLIALPELWVTGFAQSRIRDFLAPGKPYGIDGVARLEAECQERGAELVFGYPEVADGGHFYNALNLPSVSPRRAYRKLMVYTDVEKNFRSARDLTDNALAFVHRNSRHETFVVAVQLCADLRFPEIARAGSLIGAGLILNCSQWRAKPRIADTGPAYPEHWSILLQARAIENQVYAAGCGAKGTAYAYDLLGNSLVYDPVGQLVQPQSERTIESGRVLHFRLDMSRVGPNADPQAPAFIPWIEEMAPVIERVTGRTRALLGTAARQPRSDPSQYDVFLSHSSRDNEEAREVAAAAQQKGMEVFLAARTLQFGDDFNDEIKGALLKSRELWLLVTPDALRSEWVTTEWGAAWALGKLIVPLLLRVSLDKLPERLRTRHAVDYHRLQELIEQSVARR